MSERDDLVNKIYDVYEKCRFPPDSDVEREFVPANCLEELITEKAVIDELALDMLDETAVKKAEELASWIHKSCKKVFATTVLCGFPPRPLFSVMQEFRTRGFDDNNLPVQYEERKDHNTWPEHFRTEHWNQRLRREFKAHQWRVQVPIFQDAQINVNLDMDHILPFIYVDEDTREGTFGKVYQVTIHRDHMESPMLKVRSNYQDAVAAVTYFGFVNIAELFLTLGR